LRSFVRREKPPLLTVAQDERLLPSQCPILDREMEKNITAPFFPPSPARSIKRMAQPFLFSFFFTIHRRLRFCTFQEMVRELRMVSPPVQQDRCFFFFSFCEPISSRKMQGVFLFSPSPPSFRRGEIISFFCPPPPPPSDLPLEGGRGLHYPPPALCGRQ